MPTKKSKFKFAPNRKYLILAAFLLGLIGLIYYFKSWFIVAWVNGRPITRMTYVAELSKIAKTQALDSLLTKQLINEEANKRKVSVSKEEIDVAIKSIEERATAQGTSLDELLKAQNVSLDSVREEIRLQKLLEKMVEKAEASEEEIKTYFDENKAVLFADKKFDEVKKDIAAQLQQQNLVNKMQELIAKLQSEAKVVQWLK